MPPAQLQNVPSQVLLELDVRSEELPEVYFGRVLALLHVGQAVLQLSDFRCVIGAPRSYLLRRNESGQYWAR